MHPHIIPKELLQTAKNGEIAMIRKRMKQRTTKIINTINQCIIKYNLEYAEIFSFNIDNNILNEIENNITNVLFKWAGGKSYKHAITSDKQAKHKVRTYWNREKPVPLGNYLFSYVFGALFQYVMYDFKAAICDKERLKLFIHIFEALLNEQIQFPKSMRRPLILDACFFKKNKFKQCCDTFVKCFDYDWKHAVKVTRSVRDENGKSKSEYVGNPNRSKGLCNSFHEILMKIKNDLQLYSNISQELMNKINDFNLFIDKLITTMDSNHSINNSFMENELDNISIPPCINQRENNTTIVMNAINNFNYNIFAPQKNVNNNMKASGDFAETKQVETTRDHNNFSQNGQTHFNFSFGTCTNNNSAASNSNDNISNITNTPTTTSCNSTQTTPREKMPTISLPSAACMNSQQHKPQYNINKFNPSNNNNFNNSFNNNFNNNIPSHFNDNYNGFCIDNNNSFLMPPHSTSIMPPPPPTPMDQHYCPNIIPSFTNHPHHQYYTTNRQHGYCVSHPSHESMNNNYCVLHRQSNTVENVRYNPMTNNKYCNNNRYNHSNGYYQTQTQYRY